ncbi:hypothetical protein NDU88_009204 [Pleurodeles waltl]|uniref:Uncharacterized protein n=1 Tax=Pleurodeles waltl TaxID=8319 RepID=A0AAV7QTW9_PLEWA|nr:hypothetical protein NDU88_009204 [Pleurodeles waltl]
MSHPTGAGSKAGLRCRPCGSCQQPHTVPSNNGPAPPVPCPPWGSHHPDAAETVSCPRSGTAHRDGLRPRGYSIQVTAIEWSTRMGLSTVIWSATCPSRERKTALCRREDARSLQRTHSEDPGCQDGGACYRRSQEHP